jgi:hypothetical protein
MTHDTFATKLYGAVYRGRAGEKLVSQAYEPGEAGIYPAYAVRRSVKKIYLCKSGELFYGIADCPLGHDLDTVIATTEDVECFERGSKNIVAAWMVAATPTTDLDGGEPMCLSATDGMLKKFAYGDGVEATDSYLEIVGNFCGDSKITGSSTNNQIIDLMMSN